MYQQYLQNNNNSYFLMTRCKVPSHPSLSVGVYLELDKLAKIFSVNFHRQNV